MPSINMMYFRKSIILAEFGRVQKVLCLARELWCELYWKNRLSLYLFSRS